MTELGENGAKSRRVKRTPFIIFSKVLLTSWQLSMKYLLGGKAPVNQDKEASVLVCQSCCLSMLCSQSLAVLPQLPSICAGERVLASGSVQLPRFTLLESGSLLVSPAHLSDAGTYTCMASNSRGIDEASASLLVWGESDYRKGKESRVYCCFPYNIQLPTVEGMKTNFFDNKSCTTNHIKITILISFSM